MTRENMTKYWFDTEFIEDGSTIDLISIGIVCEDDREFYAESSDVDLSRASEWVKENVLPHLWSRQPDKRSANIWSRDGGTGGLLSRAQIAGDFLKFINHGESRPEFWAYYGDYDWIVLCQLYGTMMDLPKSWPMFAMDVKQLCVSLGDPRLPKQTGTEHNALEDARWTRDAWHWLTDTKTVTQPKYAPIKGYCGFEDHDGNVAVVGADEALMLARHHEPFSVYRCSSS